MSQKSFLLLFICVVLLAIFYTRTKKYTLVDLPYEIDLEHNNRVFRGSVHVEGVKANQLYIRAKSFFLKNFKDSSSSIKVDNKRDGILIGRGLTDGLVSAKMAGVDFETPVEIHIKDGSYRYEISNMIIIYYGKRLDLNEYLRLIEGSTNKISTNIEMNHDQYKSHMLAMKPFTDLIAQLKDTMAHPATTETME